MAINTDTAGLPQRLNRELKILPNPSAFFDILSESDVTVRCKKLGNIEFQYEEDEPLKDGTQSLCSTTLSHLDQALQNNIPELLQQLAGNIYIDKQRLKKLGSLGEGGFAVVERMELHSEDKKSTTEVVAVKKLKPGVIENDEDLKELVEESNLLRRVRHKWVCLLVPNWIIIVLDCCWGYVRGIVEFKGIGCFDERSVESMRTSIFLAEEFMSGGTLKNVILQQMRLGSDREYWMEDAWRWLMQIAEALAYLHMCTPSVVHRDVKPENVLMSSKKCELAQAKIADFGLHKRINKISMMNRAKSSNLLDSLTSETTEGLKVSNDRHSMSVSEGIAIPAAAKKRSASVEHADLSLYALDMPSHFRIIKKSTSLCSGVHRESPLWMVPEDSPVTESELDYQHLSSAFSVPQVLIHDDLTPARLASPAVSQQESSTSLVDVVDQLQNEDSASGSSDDDDDGTSASLETNCSENPTDKRVRGGQLAQVLGVNVSSRNTPASKQSKSSQVIQSPFQTMQLGENSTPLHFLFEPDRKLNAQTKQKGMLEKKQRGGNNALEYLHVPSTPEPRCPVRAKDAKKSFRASNKFALGLSGTNVVSGVVGSLMYMAPEVYKGKSYDEKVDVFGFGVVMYELLLSELVIIRVLAQARRPSEMHHMLKKHAKSVAKGHREEIPPHWPASVRQLVQDCWHQSPDARPRMTEVIERLKAIKDQGCIKQMDKSLEKLASGSFGCRNCCIVM